MANTKIQSEQVEDDIALGGNPTTTTQSAGNNTTRVATTAFVTTAVANLVDSAPSALDTLNELAAAMGDDASFSTTITNSIATKLPLAGGTMTGNIAHASDFTIDAGGDITLDADGADIILKDGGTSFAELDKDNDNFRIKNPIADGDIKIQGVDGSSTITALDFDMSAAGAATFNSSAVFGGDITANTGSSTTTIRLKNNVTGTGGTDGAVLQVDSNEFYIWNFENDDIIFGANNSEKVRIDSSGKLTYGGLSYGVALDPDGSGGFGSGYNFETNGGSPRHLVTGPVSGQYLSSGSSPFIAWYTGASASASTSAPERLRIDSSGNLLVGTTDSSVYNNSGSGTGINLQNFGNIAIARDGNDCLALNRLNSDGAIANFNKDGTNVGVIGSDSTDIFIGTGDTGIRFNDAVNGVLPYNTGSGQTDATLDLGFSSVRWKDLYLSGGAYVGGTGSANYLDDYEEGTWTPSNSGNITINSTENATYTKVGRHVTASCWLKVNLSSANGVLGGLPFSGSGRTTAAVSNITQQENLYNQVLGTTVYFYGATSSGTNDDILFSISYDT